MALKVARLLAPPRRAWLLVASGGLFVVAGVALIYPPAAVILAGVGLLALGLFGIEVRS